jgi:uncharacterized protein (DUF3084 family)
MVAKSKLQKLLSDQYGINKNISDALSATECQELMTLLESENSAVSLINSFAAKNQELAKKNSLLGTQRYHAEMRYERMKAEYQDLQATAQSGDRPNVQPDDLAHEVATLQTRSQNLEQQVQALGAEKQELAKANHELQKDNKRLKNIVDAIRLKFSKDVDQLLKYEDSEIRVMLAKLYRSTLG